MPTMRRWVVGALTALLAVGALASMTDGGTPGEQQARLRNVSSPASLDPFVGDQLRPNIVVIMLDDMRDDELRFMPHARRLIERQGVRFVNSFSPHPLCCPARASFLSGEYTHNHRVWSNSPPWGFSAFTDDQTMPVWLQEAGYNTVFLGKYLNGYGGEPLPDGSSSATYVPPGWTDWRGSVGTKTLEPDDPFDGGTYRYYDLTLNENGVLTSYDGRYQTEVLGEHSVEAVRRYALSPKPFFLLASYVAPHWGLPDDEPDDPGKVNGTKILTPARPAHVRGEFDDVLRDVDDLPGVVGEADAHDKPFFVRDVPDLTVAEEEAVLESARQRAETIKLVDEKVAETMRALRRTGELDNTVVVLTSDNGYFLGEHRMRQGKILPYEPSLRVPTIMRGPGVPAGEVRTDPITTIDFTPTALDIAGAPAKASVDGVSLLDVARDGDRGWTRGILTETGPREVAEDVEESDNWLVSAKGPSALRFSQGVRTPDYLYVEHASKHRELYDLRTDSAQLDNVVDDPDRRATVAQLARVLDRLRNCAGAAECSVPLPPALQNAG